MFPLENKVAIVQGPPGCGKTFLGTKLCEFLLKTTENLDTPILVLTYKNHALDEFLKHTMKFCDKDKIIRIGGRSKEPELDDCNLNVVMKNSKNFGMVLSEIHDKKDNLNVASKEFSNRCNYVVKATSITAIDCLIAMSESQLLSLLQHGVWTKFKFKNKKFAGTKIVNDLIAFAYYLHESLEDFVRNVFDPESEYR